MNNQNTLYQEHYQLYFGSIRAYVLRRVWDTSLADDITQEVFLNAFRFWHQLKTPESPLAWLYVIARNAINQHIRKNQVVQLPLTSQAVLDTDIEHVIQSVDVQALFAMVKLTPCEIQAIHMHYEEGLTRAQIGERLGITEGAVKVRLKRARRKLHDLK